MQVRPGCAPGCPDATDKLALAHHFPNPHRQFRTVQEGAVQAHPVIDHQQTSLE